MMITNQGANSSKSNSSFINLLDPEIHFLPKTGEYIGATA